MYFKRKVILKANLNKLLKWHLFQSTFEANLSIFFFNNLRPHYQNSFVYTQCMFSSQSSRINKGRNCTNHGQFRKSWVVMRKSKGSHEKITRKSWEIHEKVMRNSRETHEKVMRKSRESQEKFKRNSGESHDKVMRKLWKSIKKVRRKS